MSDTALRARRSALGADDTGMPIARAGERAEALGMVVMRGGLGLIFLWFGGMKFTSYAATGIAPFIANSPLVGWWHALLGIQGAATMLGVFEIATGVLLLAGFVTPILSLIGSAMATLTFAITLSFLLTTPGVAEPLAGGFPALSAVPGQFLLKDVGLFGISLFILGDSLARAYSTERGVRVLRLGAAVLRYGLALIFLWFGGMKFTSYEATGIAPFIANSPLVGWWHALLGIQGASIMVGLYEIATAVLLALYGRAPRAAVIGGAMAVLTFLITVSFFFTTPGVTAPTGFPLLSNLGEFLLKDAGLLGISIWLFGEALIAASRATTTDRADRN